MNKSKKISSIITVIVSILVLTLGLGLILNFAVKGKIDDNNQPENKDFYVTLNGEYVEDNTIYEMHPEHALNILVFAKEEFADYKVEIMKNENCDFKFTQNGKENTYKEMIVDLSKAFIISDIDGGFKIQPKSNDVAELFDYCIGGDAIEIDKSTVDWSIPFFKVIISSKNGNQTVIFLLSMVRANSIKINSGGIVFWF